jgi:acetate kinase
VKVLVVNAGSSSLKFTLFAMTNQQVLAKGIVERIGASGTKIKYENVIKGIKQEQEIGTADHTGALQIVCKKLADPEAGVVKSLTEVNAIGHRVVHGGEKITSSKQITEEIKKEIRSLFSLAPLHNPPNLDGIIGCEEVFPGTPNVAVFDTAFHQTMPKESYLYGIPYELYQKYGIRRYGFHGTSHNYVYDKACEQLKLDPTKARIITCHLGNGSSVTAIDGGKVLDTSMGMTPLAGLVMGTRSGDVDPGIIFFLGKQGMTMDEIDTLLNKKSGMLGLGGIHSGDMRDMGNAAASGNQQAVMTLNIVVHRLLSYIGAYYALLGGADAIVLTGGIGENSSEFRALLLPRLACFGIEPDMEANKKRGVFNVLSRPGSKTIVVSVPTDEELMIAKETERIVKDL